MVTGTVSDFSDDRGLGTVTSADGQPFLFHVIEIADGSRSIEVGQQVAFEPLLKFGRFQAGSLHKV